MRQAVANYLRGLSAGRHAIGIDGCMYHVQVLEGLLSDVFGVRLTPPEWGFCFDMGRIAAGMQQAQLQCPTSALIDAVVPADRIDSLAVI